MRQSANGLLPVFSLEFVGKGWLHLRAACHGGEREAVASRRVRAARAKCGTAHLHRPILVG